MKTIRQFLFSPVVVIMIGVLILSGMIFKSTTKLEHRVLKIADYLAK